MINSEDNWRKIIINDDIIDKNDEKRDKMIDNLWWRSKRRKSGQRLVVKIVNACWKEKNDDWQLKLKSLDNKRRKSENKYFKRKLINYI